MARCSGSRRSSASPASAVWLVVFALSRYASLASIGAAIALPFVALALGEPWPVVVFVTAAAVGVLLLHRANIARLRSGTESRFDLRRLRRPSQLARSVWRAWGSPVLELAPDLADRPVPLGEHVVGVDRLQVDLAREEEVGVVEARIAVDDALEREAHGVLDEARLQMGVLDDEQLVRPLEQLVDRASSSSSPRSRPAARR